MKTKYKIEWNEAIQHWEVYSRRFFSWHLRGVMKSYAVALDYCKCLKLREHGRR